MKQDPSRHFVAGRQIAARVAFVPCRLCRAPIDLATSQTLAHVCAACALASYVHRWN
ncbi:MAG TPA: hypothetical protein VGQ38_04125 [Gaiellaceae bacterium]|nr:hypothetical protein [Gaiellaceae bacterium]